MQCNIYALEQKLEYSFLRSHSCRLWIIILRSVKEISLFVTAWRRERKSVAGHESDKLIESYRAQPTEVRAIFDYQANYQFN